MRFDPQDKTSRKFSDLSTQERNEVSRVDSPEFTRFLETLPVLSPSALATIFVRSMANLTGASEQSIVSSLLSQTDFVQRELESPSNPNSGPSSPRQTPSNGSES